MLDREEQGDRYREKDEQKDGFLAWAVSAQQHVYDTFMREYTHRHIYRTVSSFDTTDARNSHSFPQRTPAIFSSEKTLSTIFSLEKTVNLWWSAVRGTGGQPVILNTLGLA